MSPEPPTPTFEVKPFDPWDACHVCEDGLDALSRDIRARVRTIMPSSVDPRTIHCDVERDGPELVVHVDGPPVSRRVEHAIGVRVLDAVWHSGGTFGHVDVDYHATPPHEAGS